MTELERALVLLGRELELPPAPDVAARVRTRVESPRRRGWWIAAVALAVVAATVALAVPGSRASILRFFHLRGAEVRIVDRAPTLPRTSGLGARIDPSAALFRLLRIDGRDPEAVYAAPGEGYWLRYPDALLFEYRSGGPGILKKVAGGGADVEYVSVGGDPGVWVGRPHAVYLPGGGARTAGRVLLWQHGALLLRLEAELTRDEAIRLALRVR